MSPDRGVVPEAPKFSVEEILIAGNRGPCGGVNMAVEALDQVLDIRDEAVGFRVEADHIGKIDPKHLVYGSWDLINNVPKMAEYRRRGYVSVKNDLTLVPRKSALVISAHSVSPQFRRLAEEMGHDIVDTSCPLVIAVQTMARNSAMAGKKVGYIGVDGHPETVSVLGQFEELGKVRGEDFILIESEEDLKRIDLGSGHDWVVYSQTTLMPMEVDVIEKSLMVKYPDIFVPDKVGLCYATHNRQEALDDMIKRGIDALVVVGSSDSHNSQMLKRRGEWANIPSYSVDYPEELQTNWFQAGINKVGVTSGASVLDMYMNPVVDWVQQRSQGVRVSYLEQVVPERQLTFNLPQDQIEKLRLRWVA